MASWQWSFPANGATADTATVFFNASPATAVDNWRSPLQDSPMPRQVFTRTMNGSDRAYQLGTEGRKIVLVFKQLNEGASGTATAMHGYLGIKEFLLTHTEYGLTSFGYYDADGSAELEVRYLSGIETFRRVAGNRYNGTITLAAVI